MNQEKIGKFIAHLRKEKKMTQFEKEKIKYHEHFKILEKPLVNSHRLYICTKNSCYKLKY